MTISINSLFEWFSRLADILGIISFGFAIPTFFISRNIKKQIDFSIDLHDFSDSKSEYLHKIEGFIDSLKQDHLAQKTILLDISGLLSEIKTRFRMLTNETTTQILSIENFIEESCKSNSVHLSLDNQNVLIKNLICLKELLRKEDRTYVQK